MFATLNCNIVFYELVFAERKITFNPLWVRPPWIQKERNFHHQHARHIFHTLIYVHLYTSYVLYMYTYIQYLYIHIDLCIDIDSGARKWSCLFVWESISINFLCCFQDVAFNNPLANFQQPMNVKTRDSNIWLYWAWHLHTLQSCWVVWIACQGSIRILSPHLIRKWNKKVDYDVLKDAFLIPHGPTKKDSHTHTEPCVGRNARVFAPADSLLGVSCVIHAPQAL